MKSFMKFIAFIIIWMVFYYIFGRLFNWGLNFLVNALNLDSILGIFIFLSICSSVLWGVLFYPTLLLGGVLIDKILYASISLVLMVAFNAYLIYLYCQYSWYMVIIGLVHATATILPLWGIRLQLKQQKEKEYKENLKAEIIDSLQNEGK